MNGGAGTGLEGATDWEGFFRELTPVMPAEIWAAVPPLPIAVHGVIIAGPVQPAEAADYAELVAALARKLVWPVLADGLSPLRNHAARSAGQVSTYDVILRNPAAAERLRPERVLCLGGWPISKVLRGWVEASGAPILLVSEGTPNRDAVHGRTQHLRCSLSYLVEQLPDVPDANGYTQMWPLLEGKVRSALDGRLQAMTEMFEGRAPWLLARHLPAGTPMFVANSMPVRDVEYFWPPNDRGIRPVFNRGANGIDGTLSTALGLAHGNQPTVLLTGDLALLHDTNGFLSRPKLRGSLTIVLINNRGGGIFEHLPVAKVEPAFEEFFATPQEADFARLCAAYGVEHVSVSDWPQFTALISQLPATGIRLLEIRTDRKRDAATRKAMFAEIAAGL